MKLSELEQKKAKESAGKLLEKKVQKLVAKLEPKWRVWPALN